MGVKTDPVTLLGNLFNQTTGEPALSISPLPESGSYRLYFRITGRNRTAMGVFNQDRRENEAFLSLNKSLAKAGARVPEIYAADLDRNIYLEEDLGDITLLDYLGSIRKQDDSDERMLAIYRQVIAAMPVLQIKSHPEVDYRICYPRAEFDRQSMMWDMNYFKYCLLKPLKIGFFEQDLEDDFNCVVDWLISSERQSFMFRDFQSRNIMLFENEVCFIDFQGGRRGPLQYDLASLLFEAKTHIPFDLKQLLLNHYLDVFGQQVPGFDRCGFMEYYYGFVYLRLMQAMGAYGFRGYIEQKPLFLQSLPYAVDTLQWLEKNQPLPLPLKALPGVFSQLTGMARIREYIQPEIFTIGIHSFAYKNGIPQDHSGHGGGFVFDCRSITNPGRYDHFRALTGLDATVKEYLENKEDAMGFFSLTSQLIEQAVSNYISRGFTSMMVCYGCTGGQHRSVFMAEKLKRYLQNKFQLNIVVIHHELDKGKDA